MEWALLPSIQFKILTLFTGAAGLLLHRNGKTGGRRDLFIVIWYVLNEVNENNDRPGKIIDDIEVNRT